MDGARWQRVQSLFHEVADLPHSDQSSFLKRACGEDHGLMADVLAMLGEDARGDSLLDRDTAHVAHQILDVEAPATFPFAELGPYRVTGVLGEGGMGVVYLAEREDLGNKVAIKLLRDAWLSPARCQRFTSEQRTMAQLNHPSIAHLYDADVTEDGTPFFVMEYVEGLPITEYCTRHTSSIEQRLRLFGSVCEAVQYAHAHAVIHCDLKPSNILVKQDGSVRLLDFGISKRLESLDVPTDQNLTGLSLLTPAYASPEQIRGERIGTQSDVYSLGVILYELLAGAPPFDLSNLSATEAERVLLEKDPVRPSLVARRNGTAGNLAAPDVSKQSWFDLDVLCLTAMHRDIAHRYRSIEALARDVDHYLRREPLEARPDSVRYRISKFTARHRAAVAAAGLALTIVVGLVTFYTMRIARARNEALAEAARTQRIQRFTMNLFKGGDQDAGPSDQLRVVTLLDRGVQQAQMLDAEPETQGELYETLGTIYQQLGKFDRADGLLQLALEKRKKVSGADSRAVARTLVMLGLLRADQGKYEEAETFSRNALEMSRRHLPADHPELATAIFAVGKVLEDRGHYDDAIQMLDEAVRLQSRPGSRQADLAASLSELANTNFYAAHYDVSKALNERALSMERAIYGERHPEVADTLINLGAIQFQLGNYPESEHFYRQALDIVHGWYGNDHPETADTMTFVGQALTGQKKYDEASDLLQQSRAILKRIYGPSHERVAFADNELGNVALRQGHLSDAEADFREAISIYRTTYGDSHYQVGIAQCNLGGVYLQRKDYARAESLIRDSLQTYAKSVSPTHYNVGIARVRLGAALLGQHRYHEAEQESLTGYDILMKKANANLTWVQNARKDLVQIYAALGQPDKAAKFR
jgi:eukaryotic-like serine/threonine-protein kinase